MATTLQAQKRFSRECTRNTRFFFDSCSFASIRGQWVFVVVVIPHVRSGFQEEPGGVFLTVITTSHAPFAMNSRIAGKKYLLTGMC